MFKHSAISVSLISCIILSTLQKFRGDYQAYRLLRSARVMLDGIDNEDDTRCVESTELTRNTIDKEVRPILSRMEARLCVMCDQPAALLYSVQHSPPVQSSQWLPPIPEAFTTLPSARDCLESILDWGHDHVLNFFDDGNNETLNTILHHHIEQWQAALDLCRSSDTSKTFLQMASLNGLILLSTFNAQAEIDFDAYNLIFGRIMDLVAQLHDPNHAHACVSFGTDTGLIDIVAFVGSRCWDPVIRRSAMNWLHGTARFEGGRLSSDSGHIIRAWMTLEEAVSNIHQVGDILETARRRLVAGECYHAHVTLPSWMTMLRTIIFTRRDSTFLFRRLDICIGALASFRTICYSARFYCGWLRELGAMKYSSIRTL